MARELQRPATFPHLSLGLFVLTWSGLVCGACHSGAGRHDSAPDAGPPEKIVALAPSLAHIVADMGGAGTLIGISSYGRVPRGAERAERIGGFIDPSIERIIGLGPDLVIGVPLQQRPLDSCRAAGLAVLEVNCESLTDVLQAYEILGQALDRHHEAQAASEQLRRRLERIRRLSEGRPRARTLFLLGLAGEDLQQVYPVGPGNFTNELLEIAGGENVLTRAAVSISTESVIALAPAVIIEVAMDERGDGQERMLTPSPFWSRLESVPAVRTGRVYSVASSSLLQPGPQIAAGAELLYRLLHEGQSSASATP